VNNGTPAVIPLWAVREVIETFRRYHIVTPDWVKILTAALQQLEAVDPSKAINGRIVEVVSGLRQIIEGGLEPDVDLLERISGNTQAIISMMPAPGLPTPEDENWAFPKSTAS
jgi:hypothetical protein